MLSFIAFQNLRKKKFRSFITIFSVAIGTTTLLIFLGLSNAIDSISYEQAEKQQALDQITVRPNIKEQGLTSFLRKSNKNLITQETVNQISQLPEVKNIFIQTQFNGFASLEAEVFGVNFVTDSMVFGHQQEFLSQDLPSNIDWNTTEEPYPALVPRKLLDLYNLTIAAPQNLPTFQEDSLIGKKIILYPNYSSFFPINNKTDKVQLEIVGFSDRISLIGVTIPQQRLQELNQKFANSTPQGYNEIHVQTKSPEQVVTLANKIEQLDLNTEYLQKNFQNIQAKLGYLNYTLLIISIVIFISTIIAISTSFIATLSERRQENKLLRTLGASKTQLYKIIILESSIIGLLGAISGTLVALTISHITNNIQFTISILQNQQLVQISFLNILGSTALAILISIISAYLPAINKFKDQSLLPK